MVLIPLSTLKQPFIGIKPFIWDRDTTDISVAGYDLLADYYRKQFQRLLSLHLWKPYIEAGISFWRSSFSVYIFF